MFTLRSQFRRKDRRANASYEQLTREREEKKKETLSSYGTCACIFAVNYLGRNIKTKQAKAVESRSWRGALIIEIRLSQRACSSDSEVRNVISLLPHDDKTFITSVAFWVCARFDLFHTDFTCISWPSACSDKLKIARLRDRCSLKVQDNDYSLTETEKALHKLSGLHAHERIWPYLSAFFSIASLTHAPEL